MKIPSIYHENPKNFPYILLDFYSYNLLNNHVIGLKFLINHYIYIYIYINETFESPTIFHVITIFFFLFILYSFYFRFYILYIYYFLSYQVLQ